MPPPTLSYGLNLPNKKLPPSLNKPGQKRKKTIFDSDSDGEDERRGEDNGAEEISTIGGLEVSVENEQADYAPKLRLSPSGGPPPKRRVGDGERERSINTNAHKPGKPTFKPLSKKSMFADDEEYEGTTDIIPGMDGTRPQMTKNKTPTEPSKDYTNLSTMHSSKKHAKEAEELDPSIYSYDAVYDSIHRKPEKTTAAGKDADAKSNEVPKYMASLLRSAEIRKRDQLRARDRLLAKEREAEGDEFADKEKFVTAAYKAQQEELRRIEEEEARREKEEEERRRKNGGIGMVGFYRDMLARGEQRHEAAVKAAEEVAKRVQAGESIPEEDAIEKEQEEKTAAQIAAELNARGARVEVNDEGQVIDKRQLLSAGLNVAPKPKKQPSAPATAARTSQTHVGRPSRVSDAYAARAAQRSRQTDMVAAQLEERARQEEEAEAARQRELAERSRSHKTEKDVSSARERYLARKREREEAERKQKEKGNT
ncbi:hypothetical protein MPDQ_003636 [Monascus purpureus]|uniref:Nuclear speckle splicing regulatory protein 1 N-terminal domain-containing protein n=1 Tax=Monascus purpureus TaxID=5098 RepID=A0A507R0W8_MONPU|nr:hypothetical protein MPDQ_003636 [Monascus purpureus]